MFQVDLNTWQLALTGAFANVLQGIVMFLPNLFGALLVFFLGLVLANWAKALVIKGLRAVKVGDYTKNSRVEKFLKNAEITQRLEEVIGSIVKWILVLIFFVAAVNILGLTAVSAVLTGILNYIPNVISAVIILTIGILLAGLVESLIKGSLSSVNVRTARLMGKIGSYTVVTFALLAAISELQIAQSFINTLFMGFIVMLALGLGLAIGLGSKDLVAEVLNGWYHDLKKDLDRKS